MDFDGAPKDHLNVCGGSLDNWIGQDFANRLAMPTEEAQSQSLTFAKGLDFLQKNHDKDNWFLQLETFDLMSLFIVRTSTRICSLTIIEAPYLTGPTTGR